jgi:predicted small lipoprotein YifL
MHCWARYLLIVVVFLLGFGQLIAACGQKGDLYLPEPEEKAEEKEAPNAKTDDASANRAGAKPEPVGAGAEDVPQVAAPEASPAGQ